MLVRSISALASRWMKSAVLGALALTALPLAAQTLTQRWSNSLTSTAAPYTEGKAVKTGPDGQVVSVFNAYDGLNVRVIQLVKSDASTGATIWQAASNPPAFQGDGFGAMTFDAAGNVIVVGFRAPSSFWPSFYIAKFAAANGALLWQRVFSADGYDSFVGVAVDSQENIIAAGTTREGGISPIRSDFFACKFASASGETLWQSRFSTPEDFFATDQVKAMTLDAAGDAYLTGFGATGTSYRALTVKMAGNDGRVLWSHLRNDSAIVSSGDDIAVDSSGNVVVGCNTANGDDGFRTVKYRGSDGAQLWMNHRTSSQTNQLASLAVDPTTGNVAVTGHTFATATNEDVLTMKIAGSNGSTQSALVLPAGQVSAAFWMRS